MTSTDPMAVYGHLYCGYGVVKRHPLFFRLTRTIPHDFWPAVPTRVMEGAMKPVVDIHCDGLTTILGRCSDGSRYAAVDWIFASQSWPHQDESFEGMLFITLILESSHVVGFEYGGSIVDIEVKAGDILIFDPMITHWLHPFDYEDIEMKPWVGLQWTIATSKWRKYFRTILREMRSLRELQMTANSANSANQPSKTWPDIPYTRLFPTSGNGSHEL